jgi:NAD(P)-dependent dehydrogenase (short-subunit alcohol dehydrogenase family)
MKAIVISASSDIGAAACERWISAGWEISGTYRNYSEKVARMEQRGAFLVKCDLAIAESIRNACVELGSHREHWDVLVLAAVMLEPVGPFIDGDFDEWEASLQINLVSQLRAVRGLMRYRASNGKVPTVIFFAGGGTNNAVVNYSSYTLSKIGLIKMCELLDAEVTDTKFVILGPGWVNTKIHDSTIAAGPNAGDSYYQAVSRLENDNWTPMAIVLECCDWVIREKREIVSGRNFSVVNDAWSTETLRDLLQRDANLYKLRRFGNELLMPKGKAR